MLSALSEGRFLARPGLLRRPRHRPGHSELVDRRGQAWLPIGCFLAGTRDRCVLADAGWADRVLPRQPGHPARLVGGQLPLGLPALAVERDEVGDVVGPHLHPTTRVAVGPGLQAKLPPRHHLVGAGDWRHFIQERPPPPASRTTSTRLRQPRRAGAPTPDRPGHHVAPGSTATPTPGHTPGHLCVVVVSSNGQRARLPGDAVTCPVQLEEPSWHCIGDVDPTSPTVAAS
jgi:glyoxylase-like metal-dependent hydrolase (beta-lactamase superfamily II)